MQMLLREKAMSCHFGLRAVITRYLIAKFIIRGQMSWLDFIYQTNLHVPAVKQSIILAHRPIQGLS